MGLTKLLGLSEQKLKSRHRAVIQPVTDHAALAAEIIRCGKIARGSLPPDPKPIDARAQFILDSAKKARG
jgi:hypothetical protein